MWENPKRVEAAIKRFTREIEEIDDLFYKRMIENDRASYAGMLERKRDDMVRSAVLQMHTAIEDLLDSLIISSITGTLALTDILAANQPGLCTRCFMVAEVSVLR